MGKIQFARQFVSFGLIGIAATLTHVAVAWSAYSLGSMHPALANLMGAIAAFLLSFLGNRSLTFQSSRPVSSSASRYLAISFLSYLIATGIMLITDQLGLPTYIFALLVILSVPPLTFLLAKFWAFSDSAEARHSNAGPDRCH